ASFILSNKEGKEAYVEPVVEGAQYRLTVKVGDVPSELKNGTKLARGANFRCLLSDSAIEPDYIKAEGTAKRLGTKLMVAIAEGARGRVYLPPTLEIETAALAASATWKPQGELVKD